MRFLDLVPMLGMVSCAAYPRLEPLASAHLLADTHDAARVVQSNVAVTVEANQWDGHPGNLPELLTPLLVTLENGSNRPLRVRSRDFALVGQAGFRYPAIAPLSTEDGETDVEQPEGAPPPNGSPPPPDPSGGSSPPAHLGEPSSDPPSEGTSPFPPIEQAAFTQEGPAVAGSQPPIFTQVRWSGGGSRGHVGGHFQHRWRRHFRSHSRFRSRFFIAPPEPLPTNDMLEQALPEGVAEAGGMVAGFVYFPGVPREAEVIFELDLVDAQTDATFGKVSIPFRVIR